MFPIIELRGIIPLGIAMGLNPVYIYITCVIGSSIISIPVILIFRQVIDYLRHGKYFNKMIGWIDKKVESRAKKLKTASILGLVFFVGVSLPTTGSWSGAVLASIFKMRIRDALLGVFLGNAIAGAIMIILSINVAGGSIIELIIMAIIITIVVLYAIKNKKISNDLDYKKIS